MQNRQSEPLIRDADSANRELRRSSTEKVKPAVISVKVSVNVGGINLSVNKSTPARAISFSIR